MAIQATLLGAGKALMALGMMQFGASPSPLRMVLTTAGGTGPALSSIESYQFVPATGNYPLAGLALANLRVEGLSGTSAAVKANDIALVGVTLAMRLGVIYLPGTYVGLPGWFGPSTITDPIVATVDFAYGTGDYEVNGDITIAWPEGNLFVLA